MPGGSLVGREAELARAASFLDSAAERLQALAVVGPPGIGKTTVLRAAAQRAEELGRPVLSARPTGAEARLSFAALSDLLAPLEEDVFGALPAPQRRAIDIALLRHDTPAGRADGRVVASALLSLLRELAGRGPLVIAVDDAQWLDAATAETLAFAVRRVQELPLGILVSVRVEGVRPETFEEVVPEDRREEIVLGPLSVGALHDVVKRELGLTFPRPVLVRLVSECGGNPFYALEIARELARSGLPSPREPLPLPAQIRTLTQARLARLPRRTQDALLAAASLSRPTASLVDVEALVPAEEAGIVHVGHDGRVRFAHPLFASAVYDAAPAGRRRQAHRSLAGIVGDPEERARHLALVAEGPDEAVAEALDEAAARAARRGASAAAAELARRALELTHDPRSRRGVERAIDAARHLLDVGESSEALSVLAAVDADTADGDVHARLLYEQGKIWWYERDFERGYRVLLEAAARANDPELLAAIHVQAAWVSQDIDPRLAIPHTDEVLSLVDPEERPGRYSQALLHGAYLRLVSGQGADMEAYERGCELQRLNDDWDEVSPVPGMFPLLLDDFERAWAFYGPGVARSREEGDEMSVQGTLLRLVEIALWTGNWAAADELADEGMQVADRISSRAYLGGALYARGLVDAYLGRVDEARSAGERVLEPTTEPYARAVGYWILGFLASSLDDPVAAAGHFDQAASAVSALNQREPARFRFDGDHVEAVIRIGELERAEQLIAGLEERSRITPRPWIQAVTARSRALLLSARGDLDAALTAMQEALGHHDRLQMPFERARTLLELGRLLRRRKERREARVALQEALDVFQELGAPLWAELAQAELARVPVRRAPGDLTPTETTIASLAATGLTNRAIAERAFVSPKTVESNLARVYRKLGIRSRAELGRAMAERERIVET